MGIMRTLKHGLPTLNLSDFDTSRGLSTEKAETLQRYTYQIASGKPGLGHAAPPIDEVHSQLRNRGFNPSDYIGLRNYIIRNGLMSRFR